MKSESIEWVGYTFGRKVCRYTVFERSDIIIWRMIMIDPRWEKKQTCKKVEENFHSSDSSTFWVPRSSTFQKTFSTFYNCLL